MFTLLIQQFLGQLFVFCLVCSLQLQRFICDVQSLQLQLQLLCGAGRVLRFLPI